MNVRDLELFVRIAEAGSITAASSDLSMSIATASAALKRLEAELGTLLFVRSPRNLRLSNAGEHFLVHCRKSLSALEEGRRAISSAQGKLDGTIHIAMPSDIGRSLAVGWVDEIMDANPDLSVMLAASDNISDLYQDKIDMALRYGEPKDSNLVAFHLADVPRCLCAAPSYLEAFGAPEALDDLRDHNCLVYQIGERPLRQWDFESEDGIRKIRVRGNRSSDDGELVRRWALHGKGILLKPVLDVAEDLKAGRLMRILDTETPTFRALWLYCPGRQLVTPEVLLVRDHFKRKVVMKLKELNELGLITD